LYYKSKSLLTLKEEHSRKFLNSRINVKFVQSSCFDVSMYLKVKVCDEVWKKAIYTNAIKVAWLFG